MDYKRVPALSPAEYDDLIELFRAESPRGGWINLAQSVAGEKLLDLLHGEQASFAMYILEKLPHFDHVAGLDVTDDQPTLVYNNKRHKWMFKLGDITSYDLTPWILRDVVNSIVVRNLPFRAYEISQLLRWYADDKEYFTKPEIALKALSSFIATYGAITSDLIGSVLHLMEVLEAKPWLGIRRKYVAKLRMLFTMISPDIRFPMVSGEVWADAAVAQLNMAEVETQRAWVNLLNTCLKATGRKPHPVWLPAALARMDVIGWPNFREAMLKWLPLVSKANLASLDGTYEQDAEQGQDLEAEQDPEQDSEWDPDPEADQESQPVRSQKLNARNADILRGLVWLCPQFDDEELARTLTGVALTAYQKQPRIGPRSARLGNACVWALGHMPGKASVDQLAILKRRVKYGTAHRKITKAFLMAAEQAGLPQYEIDELSVPAFGMYEVGRRLDAIDNYHFELTVRDMTHAGLRLLRPDGNQEASLTRKLAMVPESIEGSANDVRELQKVLKDILGELPVQCDRIETLYLERRQWPISVWRDRYLEHPLIGVLARRLIWTFKRGDTAESGIWFDGQIVDRHNKPLTWLTDDCEVALWHPIEVDAIGVWEWRRWLDTHYVHQPFKQAHREIYCLSDTESWTYTHSNRFATHVLKQPEFHALCGARGWTNMLRLLTNDAFPPALRNMPAWNLRAEFGVEGIGDVYGYDTDTTGVFKLISTDQVRFYALDGHENPRRAGRSKSASAARKARASDPLPLEQIPPLVFSEVMRDIDQFVTGASIGADLDWSNGGLQGRYCDYWTNFAFGPLTELGLTRLQVLQHVVPQLKIAKRCTVIERFLYVRGDLRTYKIHLGTGHVLMSPNDELLRAAPKQSATMPTARVILPYEGDRMLSMILSKAFMLANDLCLDDQAMAQQIKPIGPTLGSERF